MRHDMNKVLVNCYRVSGGPARPGRPPRDLDDLPKRQGMRRPYDSQSTRKDFGENLSPLYRYLHKQLGRPWDTVFSEICRAFDTRKTINQHILLHVDQYVTREGLFEEGSQVLKHDSYEGARPVGGLYVHPRTGLLCLSDEPSYRTRMRHRREEEARQAMVDRKVVSPTLELRRIEGIWYMLEIAKVTLPEEQEQEVPGDDGLMYVRMRIKPETICRDVVTGIRYCGTNLQSWHPELTYVRRKRQASFRELKRHGIL